MELKIRISLHGHKYALEPVIETECRFAIENSQSVKRIEEVVRFIVARKLQEVELSDGEE